MKISIYMNIPWESIPQRTHHFARELSSTHEVTVIYKSPFDTSLLVDKKKCENKENILVKKIYRLPFERFSIVRKVSSFLARMQLKKNLKDSDVLIVNHPRQYPEIVNNFQGKLVFDCLDNELEFPNVKNNEYLYRAIYDYQEKLLSNSSLCVFSSETLRQFVLEKHNVNLKNSVVINNGYNSIIKTKPINKVKSYNFVYAGTISEWFDFESILFVLDNLENVSFTIIGPKEIEVPKHERIIYINPIPAKELIEYYEGAFGLIMPFKINKLIESVDPVKLYEYISTRKNVITSHYSEVLKFSDFVNYYSNGDELLELIESMVTANNAIVLDESAISNFISQNTWKNRGLAFEKELAKL